MSTFFFFFLCILWLSCLLSTYGTLGTGVTELFFPPRRKITLLERPGYKKNRIARLFVNFCSSFFSTILPTFCRGRLGPCRGLSLQLLSGSSLAQAFPRAGCKQRRWRRRSPTKVAALKTTIFLTWKDWNASVDNHATSETLKRFQNLPLENSCRIRQWAFTCRTIGAHD